ncbi:restriction endonuclease subunit S [Kocuria marina]|uniref:restriction endonuclease subunit S n=1 Tax=Kocuria marina TaxID=223184 RepID=UPI0019CF734A|nr:restriction endonuclease subunit S [Kocuria indica]MBN6842643.1 restriction endonuclease subunit S [Kocuria indica]
MDKKSYPDEVPVRLCNYTDVYYQDVITSDLAFMEATASAEQISRFSVQAGDVPITKDSETSDDIGRPSYVPKDLPGVVYGYHLAIYRSFDPHYSRFIRYLFDSSFVRAELETRTPGVTRVGLSQDTLRNLRVPTPPPPVAAKIADYLDHETAEIDAFIDQQSRLITLLDERRMATAGELIRYPAHFDDGQLSQDGLAPLKHLGTIALGKMLDTKQLDSTSTMHPYLRAANVQPLGVLKMDGLKKMRFTDHEKRALTILAGDVVVVEGGVGGFGRAAFVPTDLPGVGFQNSIIRVRPNKQSDGRFIAYALILLRHRGYINTVSSVSSMPHFTAEKVARTPVPRLPRARQSEIANELDSLWRTHSIASADAQIAIDLARERRAALITAAVTGQIDVTAKNKPAAEQLEDDIAQGLHREHA